MTIRIVTDSTSDISPEVARNWGITVVPAYVNFTSNDGRVETLKDGLDVSTDDFYERLANSETLPTTSQPTIGDFTEVYETLIEDPRDMIVSIHVSAKLSGTYNSAVQAKRSLKNPAQVEVIDSQSASMGLGLVVLGAARALSAGGEFQQVTAEIETAIPRIRGYFLLDTLEYLVKGGRISKAQGFLGNMLSVKPILAIQNGEVRRYDRVRSRRKGLQRLVKIADGLGGIAEGCIIYNDTLQDAETLYNDIRRLIPTTEIPIVRPGPSIGVHTGPGMVGIVVRTSK
jgi:DegV family protein with EDD domain